MILYVNGKVPLTFDYSKKYGNRFIALWNSDSETIVLCQILNENENILKKHYIMYSKKEILKIGIKCELKTLSEADAFVSAYSIS